MIYVFYFFAAVLVWLSFKSFLGGIRYLRSFQDSLAKPISEFTPFVSVVAPCRGIDDGLAANLSAVLAQDYPNFEVIFVVDDPLDPAVGIINAVCGDFGASDIRTKLVVATTAKHSSQKVENLRAAVLHAGSALQVFVFVDSDARPSPTWLRALTTPLQNEGVGVVTGYRWFISQEASLASELLSVWNASIASSLTPTKSSFCWGGSIAIRRDVFDGLNIREEWDGVVSDDFVLAEVVKRAGLDIVFAPQALTASIQTTTLRSLLEFTNRQMKLTRVYSPTLWLMTLVGCGVFTAVMFTAFLIVVLSMTNSLSVWISIAVIIAVSTFSIGKAWLRLKAVTLVLPQFADDLKKQFWPQITLWLISPALFLLNSVIALFSRRINWRGITYELKSPRETVIIASNNAKHL